MVSLLKYHEVKPMNKQQIIFVTILVFAAGTFTRTKLYANAPVPVVKPEKIVQTGMASWYSQRSPGIRKRTANNEIFNDRGLTAAMWGVPFNQMVKVTNMKNGKSVIVRINDRGPHKRYVRKGRVIDLSKRAFSNIASLKKGLIRIELELL